MPEIKSGMALIWEKMFINIPFHEITDNNNQKFRKFHIDGDEKVFGTKFMLFGTKSIVKSVAKKHKKKGKRL